MKSFPRAKSSSFGDDDKKDDLDTTKNRSSSSKFAVWQKRSASMHDKIDEGSEQKPTAAAEGSLTPPGTSARSKFPKFNTQSPTSTCFVPEGNEDLKASSKANPSPEPEGKPNQYAHAPPTKPRRSFVPQSDARPMAPRRSKSGDFDLDLSDEPAESKQLARAFKFNTVRRTKSGDIDLELSVESSAASKALSRASVFRKSKSGGSDTGLSSAEPASKRPSWINRNKDKETVLESPPTASKPTSQPSRFRTKSGDLDRGISAETSPKPSWVGRNKNKGTAIESKQTRTGPGNLSPLNRSSSSISYNSSADVDNKKGSNVTKVPVPSSVPFNDSINTFASNIEEDGISSPAYAKPSESAFSATRKIVSLDIEIDDEDEDWRMKLFPEPTSIEYTPEFDHIAVEVYARDENDQGQRPQPELLPGLSGYRFDLLLLEDDKPPEPPSAVGFLAGYIAERRNFWRWQDYLRKRGRMTIKIQTFVRRFIARLEYHERVKVRELEREMRQIKEIEEYLVELREKTKHELAQMKIEYEERRGTEKENVFKNFKEEGRRQMAETREMAAMKPQLHHESKVLKAKGLEMNTEIKRLAIHTKKVEDTNSKLELVASKYKKLVNLDGEILSETESLCLIESTQRRLYEEGLARIVKIIEATASDDVELIDSIRDTAQFCYDMTRKQQQG